MNFTFPDIMKSAKAMSIGEKISLYCSQKLENSTLYKNAQNLASVSARSDVTQKNKNKTATIQFNDVSSNKGFVLVFLVVVFGFLATVFLGLATGLFFRYIYYEYS